MTLPAESVEKDAVSPLELFFDLVFVFAVSQLSHHLLDHLSWRGAAETLVMPIAVFGVWSGTSFEATLLNVGRSQAQWMLLAVMLVGLFMNAAIENAFETGGWAFVVPLLLIQAGRSIMMIVTAPTRMRASTTRACCVGSSPRHRCGSPERPSRRRPGCCGLLTALCCIASIRAG
jgi:low temperature requirement protein LtrA